jgi:hypothetical protein
VYQNNFRIDLLLEQKKKTTTSLMKLSCIKWSLSNFFCAPFFSGVLCHFFFVIPKLKRYDQTHDLVKLDLDLSNCQRK